MDHATRHALLQILGREMSDISEEGWSAGWVGGTEYCVRELCRRAVLFARPQRWGGDVITPERARGLMYLAEHIGCWAGLGEAGGGYVPHHPFPIPTEHLAALDPQTA